MHRTSSMPALTIAFAAMSGLLVMGCTHPDGARAPIAGDELFNACVSCHGPDGTGQAAFAAPNIAGLPAWYVEAQLQKFRTGLRGAHPDDLEGLRMRPMSRQMMNDEEVKTVAAYVASLSPHKAPTTISDGDAAAGATSYATCAACHGADGKGKVELKAPPIAGQADWYLLSQLKKFRAGIRGGNLKDATGFQMRSMTTTLMDEKSMKNVVAYISTLAR